MQAIAHKCLLIVLLSLAGCATLPVTLEDQIPDLASMVLVGDAMFGCTTPYTPDLWKHTYEGKDVDVVLFGEVILNPQDNHGPVLAVLLFEKGTETILKAVVRVRGEVRVFQNREALVAVYPGPCDILAAHRLTQV